MIGCDIPRQIELHTAWREAYIIEKDYLIKKMMQGPTGYKPIDYSGMPHGSGGDYTLDVNWEDIRRLQSAIDIENDAIEKLTKQLEVINNTIDTLEGIDARVKYLRDYKGFRLQEIADKLGYELGYIKNVSCRNPKQCGI